MRFMPEGNGPHLDRMTEQDDNRVSSANLGLELCTVDINNGTMSKRQNVRSRLNPNPVSNVRAQRKHVVQLIAILSIWHELVRPHLLLSAMHHPPRRCQSLEHLSRHVLNFQKSKAELLFLRRACVSRKKFIYNKQGIHSLFCPESSISIYSSEPVSEKEKSALINAATSTPETPIVRVLQHMIGTIQFQRKEIATEKSNYQQISTEDLEEGRKWHHDLERRRSQILSEPTGGNRAFTDRQRQLEDQNWQF
jgi:hypothetical protein